MMKQKWTVRIILFLLFFFLLGLISDLLNLPRKYLPVDKPIKTDLMIVEGWIPPYRYHEILQHYYRNQYNAILFTGQNTPDYIPLYDESSLLIHGFDFLSDSAKEYNVTILLSSTPAEGEYAKAQIYKNQRLIYENVVEENTLVSLNLNISKNDSIIVHYPNDSHNRWEDRNLFIEEIFFNNIQISSFNENLRLLKWNLSFPANFTSDAKRAAYIFQFLDNSLENLHYVVSTNSGLSKTYNYASSATNWMVENGYNSANIVTLSYHSRRTLISFRKANKDLKFGVSSLPARSSRLRTLKELIGNIIIRLTPKSILDGKL